MSGGWPAVDGNFVISVGGARNTPAATLSIQWALEDARNSAASVRGFDETVAKFTIVNGALESVMTVLMTMITLGVDFVG
jgi:hypothetical protein